MVLSLPVRRVRWAAAYRIIASRFPPIALYERVSPDPAVWDALIAAEELVNPRLRDEIGEIHLVHPDDLVCGPGASYVMAPFTHLNPNGSRFSDGSYGVYYAASDLATAVAETAWHFGRYAAAAGDEPRYEDMRVLVGRIDAQLHDVERLEDPMRAAIYDPGSYAASQALGRDLRRAGSIGIYYRSVRWPDGCCVAIFMPRAVGLPVQERHLQYHWDGQRVARYFDYGSETWVNL